MARTIQSEPPSVTSMQGYSIPLKMSVHYIRFAAHADCPQTIDMITNLNPAHVVTLVIIESIHVSSQRNCDFICSERHYIDTTN